MVAAVALVHFVKKHADKWRVVCQAVVCRQLSDDTLNPIGGSVPTRKVPERIRSAPRLLGETDLRGPSSFEFSLRLSRACLGKRLALLQVAQNKTFS